MNDSTTPTPADGKKLPGDLPPDLRAYLETVPPMEDIDIELLKLAGERVMREIDAKAKGYGDFLRKRYSATPPADAPPTEAEAKLRAFIRWESRPGSNDWVERLRSHVAFCLAEHALAAQPAVREFYERRLAERDLGAITLAQSLNETQRELLAARASLAEKEALLTGYRDATQKIADVRVEQHDNEFEAFGMRGDIARSALALTSEVVSARLASLEAENAELKKAVKLQTTLFEQRDSELRSITDDAVKIEEERNALLRQTTVLLSESARLKLDNERLRLALVPLTEIEIDPTRGLGYVAGEVSIKDVLEARDAIRDSSPPPASKHDQE